MLGAVKKMRETVQRRRKKFGPHLHRKRAASRTRMQILEQGCEVVPLGTIGMHGWRGACGVEPSGFEYLRQHRRLVS